MQYFVARSLERSVSHDTLIQKYADGINVSCLILVADVAESQLRSGIFRFSHELAGNGELLVACRQRIHLLGDTEVDELDMSVGSHHDVRRVDVAVYISGIMQRHKSRQHVHDHNFGKALRVLLVVGEQFHGERHVLSVSVLCLAVQDIRQRHSGEQFADHMIVCHHLAHVVAVANLYESEHLHEVVVAQLYLSLTPCSLVGICRQVVEHEFDGYWA